MFSSHKKFKEQRFLRQLSHVIGIEIDAEALSVTADDSPYSWSIVGQMDALRKECERKVAEAEGRAAAVAADNQILRADFQRIIDHLGLEIVTLTGKEVRKKPVARKRK